MAFVRSAPSILGSEVRNSSRARASAFRIDCSCSSVSDSSLFCLHYAILLLFLGETVELLDAAVDALNHEWEKGIGGIVHLSSFDALQSQLEHLLFDLLLVFVVGPIERISDVAEHAIDDLALVDFFKGFGLLEDVESTVGDVVLEGQLLVDEELRSTAPYVHDGVVADQLIVVVDGLEVELALGHGHQASHAVLHVLVVVGFEVAHLVHHDSLVEPAEQRPA